MTGTVLIVKGALVTCTEPVEGRSHESAAEPRKLILTFREPLARPLRGTQTPPPTLVDQSCGRLCQGRHLDQNNPSSSRHQARQSILVMPRGTLILTVLADHPQTPAKA